MPGNFGPAHRQAETGGLLKLQESCRRVFKKPAGRFRLSLTH